MATGRTMTVLTLVLLAATVSGTAGAYEIYHWVDENGVRHFSQLQPQGISGSVSKLILDDTTPPDYDPEEDRYGIEAQAERMTARRKEMAERRDARRDRQKNEAQAPPQYRDPYRNYAVGLRYPPYYPRPPLKPEPPIEVPYETSTLKPPGRSFNR